MHGFLNIIIFLVVVLGAANQFIEKVILRPKHHKMLQKRFEAWWKIVKGYNKLKFALAFAAKCNEALDIFFGEELLSIKAVWRCFVISNIFLIATMSWVGFMDNEPFGITPWANYEKSVTAITSVMDEIIYQPDVTIIGVATMTNAPPFNEVTNALIQNKVQSLKPANVITNAFLIKIDTNTCLVTLNGTAVEKLELIQPLGHGEVYTEYVGHFDVNMHTNVSTNVFGNIEGSLNPLTEQKFNAVILKQYVQEHSGMKYTIAYSIFYFIIMLFMNGCVFIASLISFRVTLREILLSARMLSTIGLVVTNFVILLSVSIVLLLIFTIIAIPILWLVAPVFYGISNEGMRTFGTFLLGSAITLWFFSGVAAKSIALIALLPNLLGCGIGMFSYFAMRWKKQLHWVASQILLRFVENRPVPVILTTIGFFTAIVALVAKWMHLTSFL